MGCGTSRYTLTSSCVPPTNMPLKDLRLIYFNMRGQGEIIRLVLAQSGIPYEDDRISTSEWPAIKEDMPFGSLPVLQSGNHRLGLSNVIARFLAKEGGLMGKDIFEAATADSINELLHELYEALAKIHMLKDEEAKAEKQDKFHEELFSTRCNQLTTILDSGRGDHKFFLPSGVSLADLRFYQVMTDIMGFTENDNVLNSWPKLVSLRIRVADLPKIKQWVEKRPITDC